MMGDESKNIVYFVGERYRERSEIKYKLPASINDNARQRPTVQLRHRR